MINDYEATKPMTGSDHVPTNDEIISKLNDLIQYCRDGQEGFKTAAEGVEREDLKTLFYEYSQQRSQFVGVLQGLVRTLGGDPEDSGSVSAALHRGWMDIKSLVTGKDEHAILSECERGEDYAKNAYAETLKMNLPDNVRNVIQEQAQAVLAAHNRIKGFRDSTATEASRSATGSN